MFGVMGCVRTQVCNADVLSNGYEAKDCAGVKMWCLVRLRQDQSAAAVSSVKL